VYGRSSAGGVLTSQRLSSSAFWQCLFLLGNAMLCCGAFIKCRVSRQQGWHLRGQSFLPADQLMDARVSEPPPPLKAMPCLTSEVSGAIFPAACCSGDTRWRPVLAPPKGSTVAIRWSRSDSQMQSWAPGHHRDGGCIGPGRDPLRGLSHRGLLPSKTEIVGFFCFRCGTTLWQSGASARNESSAAEGLQPVVNGVYSIGTGTCVAPESC